MRLLICAGGTGGGVYPALSVLHELGSSASQVLWVGGKGGMEASLVQRAGVPFSAIPAAGVHGVGLKSLPRNLLMLMKGMAASHRILREFQPDVLLFTGGYVAAPMALAARQLPTLVYVPDIEPGMALKFLGRFADVIAVTDKESKKYLPGNKRVEVTGYPTRFDPGNMDKRQALARFGLQGDIPTLLVFGGSKGAQSINRAIYDCLPGLLEISQVIHITGERDWPEMQKASERRNDIERARYRVFAYLHEDMEAALRGSDLVVSRAGAATLGEYPLFGLPSILVPYPHAWRYQQVNAEALRNAGGAIVLDDRDLGEKLLPTIIELLANPDGLSVMREALLKRATPQASRKIADLLQTLADAQTGGKKP